MTDMITDAQRTERNGYLTTIGRRTGNPHEIEIWFAVPDDRSRILLLSGGGDHSDWVHNMDANPAVRFRIGETTFTGRGRRTRDDEQLAIRQALAAKYYDWLSGDLPNDWARTALPIVIDLEPPG